MGADAAAHRQLRREVRSLHARLARAELYAGADGVFPAGLDASDRCGEVQLVQSRASVSPGMSSATGRAWSRCTTAATTSTRARTELAREPGRPGGYSLPVRPVHAGEAHGVRSERQRPGRCPLELGDLLHDAGRRWIRRSILTSSSPTARASPPRSSARSRRACPRARSYVYKSQRDGWAEVDLARYNAYTIPVAFRDVGPDNVAGSQRRPDSGSGRSAGRASPSSASLPRRTTSRAARVRRRIPDGRVRREPSVQGSVAVDDVVRAHLGGRFPQHRIGNRQPRVARRPTSSRSARPTPDTVAPNRHKLGRR